MKTGRNDPCPCGSGKKYKKCCLGKEDVSVELLWRRLGEAHDRLVHRLMKHAHDVFGEMAVAEALDEFLFWTEEDEYEEILTDHEEFFYPWFLFNWTYDSNETDVALNGPENITVAELYAAQQGKRLDPLERRLIETTVGRPFSFYEVLDCQPGQGYRLKDIFRGDSVDVLEKMGSQNASRGDILLARLVQIDAVAMTIGSGAVLIPPGMKPELIRFRECLLQDDDPITSETLNENDFEIRELYFDIYNVLTRPPELQNTDGDPFMFHTLNYEIDSPELAFEALKPLSLTISEEDLRDDAELDQAGKIIRVTIPWNRKGHTKSKALDNTILGQLEIDDRRLKVRVNSARRAEVIRKEIKKRLGKHARYINTEIQSPESMLEAVRSGEGADHERGGGPDELINIPEVRELMEATLFEHWNGWADQKIPALGGKTPRQAVKTPDGRESVEALLMDAERLMSEDKQMQNIGPAAIEDVRRRLGLDKPLSTGAKSTGANKKTERVDAIGKMIETFGQDKLNPTYTDLALKLCARISRMRKLSIERGRIEIWAAAIVYVIARLNFLFDPENETNVTADELCAFFGTKKTTVSSKAGLIQKACDLYVGDAEFSSPEIANMFRIYDTEEGLLIPGSMINENGKIEWSENTSRAVHFGDKVGGKETQIQKDREEIQPSNETKPKEDDRQLKLFDDD
jgi:hypothetical protein